MLTNAILALAAAFVASYYWTELGAQQPAPTITNLLRVVRSVAHLAPLPHATSTVGAASATAAAASAPGRSGALDEELSPADRARKDKFTQIYEGNAWGSGESRSGWGSQLNYTTNVRALIGRAIAEMSIKSVVDAPCGDVNWQTEIPGFRTLNYTGVDIVPAITARNSRNHAGHSASMRFQTRDLVRDPLGQAYDLVICRDALQVRDSRLESHHSITH